MTGIDTNVLVRYIMQDDPKQSAVATRWIEALTVESPGFVPLVVMVELAWVLEGAYALDRDQLVNAFETLLRAKGFVVERAAVVWKAVRTFRSGKADFADALIEKSAASAGCDRTVTFDRGAVKHCGMALLG